jgi:hypothetical protein
MNSPMPAEGRATLVHSYRKLSEREIRRRLEGPLSEAERVTAQVELLRRDDDGPDTTFATGFAPTGTFEEDGVAGDAVLADPGRGSATRMPAWWLVLPLAAFAAALGWAWHAGLLHR